MKPVELHASLAPAQCQTAHWPRRFFQEGRALCKALETDGSDES